MTDIPSEIIDPTQNVKDLTEAAVKRLDDLRETDSGHQVTLLQTIVRNLENTATLRADYDEKLRDAESKRIDAIRAVDVGAVQRAAEVSAAQAQTLAVQVATSAETLRTQVAAAAIASATALAAALDPIQKDIADLRRAQYEAQGQKTQVVEGRSSNSATLTTIGVASTFIMMVIAIVGFILTRTI